MSTELTNIIERLQRLESRVVRGFTELGVQVIDAADWFRVDKEKRTVYLKSGGKSISSIWIAMRENGCGDEAYNLNVNGETVGSIKVGRER